MKNLEENLCVNCWDVIAGPNKTSTAEFFRINHKQFCSLDCYYEDRENPKDIQISNGSQTNKAYKSKNKVYKKKRKQKKRQST